MLFEKLFKIASALCDYDPGISKQNSSISTFPEINGWNNATIVELAKECVRSLSSGFQAPETRYIFRSIVAFAPQERIATIDLKIFLPETVAENGLDWSAFFQNFRIIGGISKEFVP